MKANKYFLLFVLTFFSNQSFAWNQGGFDYKVISGDMRSTPGCKTKQEASKQASTGYRFKKFAKVMCQSIGYGWGFAEVEEKGEVVCEPCTDKKESNKKFQCFVKDVTLKCVLTRRGW
jgi:hypothetical protein